MNKALVKYGANFRVVDFQALLIRGIDCDHMQHLLKRHLKLETLSSSCTFTSTAARRGDLTTLKLLVRYGAPVDPVDAATKRSVLHLMADRTRPQTRVAEFLITRGANINSCDIRGVTPLMVASMHGKVYCTCDPKALCGDKWRDHVTLSSCLRQGLKGGGTGYILPNNSS